jgi:hypothetical protein
MGFFPSAAVPDSEYLLVRSSTEVALASAARTKQAADAHHTIAASYLAKLFGKHDSVSIEAEHASRQRDFRWSGTGAVREFRFTDLTAIPQSDELTRTLRSLY